MYTIPDDFNLDTLVGSALVQVCVGPHDIQLHFDNEWVITCEDTLHVKKGGTRVAVFDTEPQDLAPIRELLMREVVGWKKTSDRSFSCVFSGGVELQCQSTRDDAEGITINPPGWVF